MPRTSTIRRLAGITATAAGVIALTASWATPAAAVPSPGGCAAVSVITARGSGESPGEGVTGSLVTQVVNASAQTVSRAAVNYPATLSNYASSSGQGTAALKTQLTDLVTNCPATKVVLMGYSQGAHVVGDVLGGGGIGTPTAPIGTAIGSHIAAVIQFGNPRHVVNQPFNVGTATRNGVFPQSAGQLQVINATYAGKIQAYCDSNDTYCDSGSSISVHTSYLNRYRNQAASFVLTRVGG